MTGNGQDVRPSRFCINLCSPVIVSVRVGQLHTEEFVWEHPRSPSGSAAPPTRRGRNLYPCDLLRLYLLQQPA